MFRIAFTVRDNALANLLKSLDGKAFDLEVRPVGITKVRTARREPGAWLAGLGATFRFTEAKAILGGGTSPAIDRAMKAKLIKRIKYGTYAKIGKE